MGTQQAHGTSGSRAVRDLARIWLAIGVACAGMCVCAPTAAVAAAGHALVGVVSEAPPGSHLGEPGAIATDRVSGDVFLADPAAGAVDALSASGGFLARVGEGLEPSGVAVAEASGDVYVTSGTVLYVFKPDGKGGYALLSEWSGADSSSGEFGELRGVAVDNSGGQSAGDVYVLDGSNALLDIFKPHPEGPEEADEGTLVRTIKGAKLEEANAVAIDASSGQVLVANSAKGAVDRFNGASGAAEGVVTGAGSPQGSFRGSEGEEGNVRAIAVEGGDLYVAEGERHVVGEFAESTGEWLGWITSGAKVELLEPDGVGVAPDGQVDVSDALGADMAIFGPGVVVPDVKTSPASKVGKTAVTFNGVVNGDGKAAKYRFEYGTTEAYGQTTTLTATGGGEEKAKAEVTGLAAGVEYHYRLTAEDENGVNVGVDRGVATRPAVEELSTGPATGIQPAEATLTGSLSPDGTDAHYLFEYGTSTSYGHVTASVDAGAGKEPVAAQAHVPGLTANTLYHYRITASDSYGTTVGEDETFTTSGPPVIQYEPPTGLGHEGATLNAKIDPGELEGTYRFQYGTTTSYGTETVPGKLAAANGYSPVSAVLTGLAIGTVYHYRLIAENSAGTTTGPDQTFLTVPPALIEGTGAARVGSTEATISAQINPLGHDTTTYLQYGTSPCRPHPEGCTDAPTPPGEDIGGGEAPVPVSHKLEGLSPESTIHYRYIAINTLGAAEGPEHTLTTQPAETPFALADGRAWELVTPPNKHGAPIEALTREGGLILAADNGNSITYLANGSVVEEPQGNRSPEQQQDIATRDPERHEWVTQDIATPQTRAYGSDSGTPPEYQFFTPDLGTALVEPVGAEPPLAPGVRQRTPYLRDDSTDTYLPLVTEENTPPGTELGHQLHFVDATPDLSHIVVRAGVALAPAPAGPGLYEWAGGKLTFISELPSGAPAAEAALGFSHVAANAISTDGSRVVWTDSVENAGHLYMRDTTTGQTLQLDAAQGVTEPTSASAQFQTANSVGSRVFFTDSQRLTPDSTAEPGFPAKEDLYECEIVEDAGNLTCRLHDLTVDSNAGEHAAVQGFLFGASEEGTTVYLVAQGVLAANEDGNAEVAEPATDNLYRLHLEGSTWTTTFIAQLSSEDAPEWQGNKVADTAFLTARVSPNGEYLAFMSQASPTGYDNRDEESGKPDEEVYLFDAAKASLTCVSCNPTGARPHGVLDTVESGEGLGLLVDRRKVWAELGREHWLAGSIPGWTSESLPVAGVAGALFQSRYLSNEGRLFFDSPDHLVSQAKSGKNSVYEYEPDGVGGCSSLTGGCVSLLSPGDSTRESAFLEATPDGSNVFFLTAAQLVPQDTDTAFDIYDARVCTEAEPCLTPPPSAPEGCSDADACRPSEPEQPAPMQAGGSETASGSNLAPAPTPHPQVDPLGTKTAVAPKPTRKELLAKALGACRKQHNRRKRAKCEAQARKRYGPAKKAGRSAARKRGRRR